MEDRYREAASVLLLRRALRGKGWRVLLLHKPRKRDAWQLPQGGMEGEENVTEAALRELREEASITNVQVLRESAMEYVYDFPASYRHYRPDGICGQRIRFVLARASRRARVRVDRKEIDHFAWVPPDRIGTYIKRSAYLHVVQGLIVDALGMAGEDFKLVAGSSTLDECASSPSPSSTSATPGR